MIFCAHVFVSSKAITRFAFFFLCTLPIGNTLPGKLAVIIRRWVYYLFFVLHAGLREMWSHGHQSLHRQVHSFNKWKKKDLLRATPLHTICASRVDQLPNTFSEVDKANTTQPQVPSTRTVVTLQLSKPRKCDTCCS